ncbi:GntR family transcriptional regulator [Pseudomonas sp. 5P_3.1_Bac2]|uniref:GntR family transcriptional regulator n=1 Tax=Pseudomonas sp. 5P_3.1_Bac2 TaxID=2971617 RepID=UPI0021CA8CE3|nr:GntR family transcriptional regulator [Pseudomonas sp. 5P_3.1_Bac2]MCU1719052.1 GntR family transcriptional regulator [Pseudomonas sp. 5P_3.1_Bac2]
MAYNGDDSENSLVDKAVNGILEGIMEGRFVQGQRLVAADLAEQFNVSRAPIREALQKLAGDGVVELLPNRGARIRQLSLENLVEFLEFSEAILVLGIRLAAPKLKESDNHAVLIEAFNEIEHTGHAREPFAFVRALYQYHVKLHALAGNGFLELFYNRPEIRFYSLFLANIVPGDSWEHYLENYRQIHETLLEGDPHTAVVTFSAHLRWVVRLMRSQNAHIATSLP